MKPVAATFGSLENLLGLPTETQPQISKGPR